ncbi:MAG TPA: hemerythrin domain-containing protein [Candidatus Kryptonia bacterium]|nr:hemerythrin domain-containing protein [Candidatus Kryptonia bacterium]
MRGPITNLLTDDHRRLDALLERAELDRGAYAEFRAGLLRHIAMEEKILLPAAQQARGGEPLPIAARLRRDHGALAALLVPSPTAKILAAIRFILTDHNAVEEAPGGVYDVCEQLAADAAEELLGRLRGRPEVPMTANVDGPRIMEAARRALARAGYELDIE